MPKLRNINPLGYVDLPLIGRSGPSDDETADVSGVGCLHPGEVFEVTAEQAGKAPHWRPITEEERGVAGQPLTNFEWRVRPVKKGDKTVEVEEILDPGFGLLAQTGNYELVTEKKG